MKNLNDYGLTKTRIFVFISSSLAAAFFEGFGMAMFLPMLEYIEKGQDISVLTAGSDLWKKLANSFDYIGLEVTLMALLSDLLHMS